MTRNDRIALLADLGRYLLSAPDDELTAVIQRAYVENQWFTPDNTREALKSIAQSMLQEDLLTEWAARYPLPDHDHPQYTVGLVMAGNIPLVGFHDWLCVFVAGERAKVKLSDKDKRLLPFLVNLLGEWAPQSREYTHFLSEHEPLRDFNRVIATGTNNTARYFQHYFGKYPHIIRHNRNGIALLDGTETIADLYALGRDVFAYFGKGCRNVSKIYVPKGYDFTPLLEALHEYRDLVLHDKYKNNFDYNFTLLILNSVPHLSNGCVLLTEDTSLTSRIASLHYEYYEDKTTLATSVTALRDQIQCIIGGSQWQSAALPLPVLAFGQSQQPGLSDYPDGVDVMAFLSE